MEFEVLIILGTIAQVFTSAISTETTDDSESFGHPDTLHSSVDELIAIESVVEAQTILPPSQDNMYGYNVTSRKVLYERIKSPLKAQSYVFDSRHGPKITHHDEIYDTRPHNVSSETLMDTNEVKYSSGVNIDLRAPEDNVYHSNFETANSLYSGTSRSTSEKFDNNDHGNTPNSDSYSSSSETDYIHPTTNHDSPYRQYESSENENCTQPKLSSENYIDPNRITKIIYQTNPLNLRHNNKNNFMPAVAGRVNQNLLKRGHNSLRPFNQGYGGQQFHNPPRSYIHAFADNQGNVHYHIHNHQHQHKHQHLYEPKHGFRGAGRLEPYQQNQIINNPYGIITKSQPGFGYPYTQPYNYGMQSYVFPENNGFKSNSPHVNKYQNLIGHIGKQNNYKPTINNVESSHEENGKEHNENSNMHSGERNENHGHSKFNYGNIVQSNPNHKNTYHGNSKFENPIYTKTVSYTSGTAERSSAEQYSPDDEEQREKEYEGNGSLKDTVSQNEYPENHPNHNYKPNLASSEEYQNSEEYIPKSERYSVQQNFDSGIRNHVQPTPHNQFKQINQNYMNNHEMVHNLKSTIRPYSPLIGGHKYGMPVMQNAQLFSKHQNVRNQGYTSPPVSKFISSSVNGKHFTRPQINNGKEFSNNIINTHQQNINYGQSNAILQDPLVLPRNARIIEHHIGLPPVFFRSFETPVILGHTVRYAVHKIVPSPSKISLFSQQSNPQMLQQPLDALQSLTFHPKWII